MAEMGQKWKWKKWTPTFCRDQECQGGIVEIVGIVDTHFLLSGETRKLWTPIRLLLEIKDIHQSPLKLF
jgi:hypothetical protein